MQDANNLKHIAIIMDGNGRWAQSRSHTRWWGHVRGAKKVSGIVEESEKQGVKALTLYAFSSENWSRPLNEIQVLFILLKKFLLQEKEKLIKNKVRFKVMGDISRLPIETKKLVQDLENETKDNLGIKLSFAFGYGGKDEIVFAANKFIAENPGKQLSNINDITNNLMVPDLGDVDLLIRTGGDQRISNFLLWQSAYAELFFTKTKWPDFSIDEFKKIIRQFNGIDRRFGSIEKEINLYSSINIASKNKVDFLEVN